MRQNLHFLLSCLVAVSPVCAVTIVTNPNPIVTANAITANVTGADLAGLSVTATFGEASGPLVFPMTWTSTGPGSGSASQSVVAVSLAGNASSSLAWHYTSVLLGPLLSLDFDGTAAGIYFDRAHSDTGTPGSGAGADIAFGSLFPQGVDSGIVVTYSKAVALGGATPQGDLYAQMTIQFPNTVNGPANFPPQDFAFTQNTDKSVVPEPASWLLLAGGLALMVLRHRSGNGGRSLGLGR